MGVGFLRRELGLLDSVLMGLGSIVGTGIFVSLGIAAGVAGPAVLLALGLAAALAAVNGLSSAQLAASHAYSGGTYEYGHEYLGPVWGFTAGWVFLCAKTASAATAALGFAGYTVAALGLGASVGRGLVALVAVGTVAGIVLGGARRSSRANVLLVSLVLATLVAFVVAGIPVASAAGGAHLVPFFADASGRALSGSEAVAPLLQATALMFVAYTGYARIATLGEEVREPRRTIPRAILLCLGLTLLLYIAVGTVAVASVGAPVLADGALSRAATLQAAASAYGVPGLVSFLALGAAVALLGVMLNLVLGLSRVLLAMGRRGEMPPVLARLDASGRTPTAAVAVTAVLIGGLAASGEIRSTWSLSAFSVLVYYAITNLAALRLPAGSRRFPRGLAVAGLLGCLGLAFWVDPPIWILGLLLIAGGLVWQRFARGRWAAHPP